MDNLSFSVDHVTDRACSNIRENRTKDNGTAAFNMVCRYWIKGRCGAGSTCKFLHRMMPSKVELCALFKLGKCMKSADACNFRH